MVRGNEFKGVNAMNDVLIDTKTLATMSPESVLIVDCRFTLTHPGEDEHDFLQAHIPGAVHASLDRDLSDLSKKGLGRHPLPDAGAFARTLSYWGWYEAQHVVTYDATGGAMAAARLWWMLTSAGIPASVLDGGWQAWMEAGLPVEQGVARPRPVTPVELCFDPTGIVDYEDLEGLHKQASMLVFDARDPPRFRGENEPLDRVAGHVPGAYNRPVSENLAVDGRFKSALTLRAEFGSVLGQHNPRNVIHMCGSGVNACQNLLAMEVADLHGSRVFVPSWSGWVSDPARPVATGEA